MGFEKDRMCENGAAPSRPKFQPGQVVSVTDSGIGANVECCIDDIHDDGRVSVNDLKGNTVKVHPQQIHYIVEDLDINRTLTAINKVSSQVAAIHNKAADRGAILHSRLEDVQDEIKSVKYGMDGLRRDQNTTSLWIFVTFLVVVVNLITTVSMWTSK